MLTITSTALINDHGLHLHLYCNGAVQVNFVSGTVTYLLALARLGLP